MIAFCSGLTMCLLAGLAQGWAGTWPKPTDTLIVVCLGNSTTAVRKGLSQPYSERLADRFRAAQIPALVFNAGKGGNHSGRTTDNTFHKGPHALDRFEVDVLSRKPDIMVLSFGINDAWQDQGVAGSSRIPLRDYGRNLRSMQQALARQGGKTLFLGPNPLGEKYPAFRMQRLSKYHRQTRRVARSTHSGWVNSFQLFRKTAGRSGKGVDQLLMDGMHPNDLGHEIIAQAIWEKLKD